MPALRFINEPGALGLTSSETVLDDIIAGFGFTGVGDTKQGWTFTADFRPGGAGNPTPSNGVETLRLNYGAVSTRKTQLADPYTINYHTSVVAGDRRDFRNYIAPGQYVKAESHLDNTGPWARVVDVTATAITVDTAQTMLYSGTSSLATWWPSIELTYNQFPDTPVRFFTPLDGRTLLGVMFRTPVHNMPPAYSPEWYSASGFTMSHSRPFFIRSNSSYTAQSATEDASLKYDVIGSTVQCPNTEPCELVLAFNEHELTFWGGPVATPTTSGGDNARIDVVYAVNVPRNATNTNGLTYTGDLSTAEYGKYFVMVGASNLNFASDRGLILEVHHTGSDSGVAKSTTYFMDQYNYWGERFNTGTGYTYPRWAVYDAANPSGYALYGAVDSAGVGFIPRASVGVQNSFPTWSGLSGSVRIPDTHGTRTYPMSVLHDNFTNTTYNTVLVDRRTFAAPFRVPAIKDLYSLSLLAWDAPTTTPDMELRIEARRDHFLRARGTKVRLPASLKQSGYDVFYPSVTGNAYNNGGTATSFGGYIMDVFVRPRMFILPLE